MALELMAIRNVVQHYGPRSTREDMGGRSFQELKKVARWEFNWNELPAPGINNLQQVIPAGSTIISARFRVLAAFTSTSTTTDLTVGLRTATGGVDSIDDDGLLTATQLTQTTIGVVGASYVGTGALVGFSIGGTAGELVVLPTVNDLTAGRAEVLVEYMLAG